MWALEQLVSCKVRHAGELPDAVANGPAAAQAMLDEAETALRHLLALSRSSERLSLLGALMKRRALLAGAPRRHRQPQRRAHALADRQRPVACPSFQSESAGLARLGRRIVPCARVRAGALERRS
jgi:hypothetical protein